MLAIRLFIVIKKGSEDPRVVTGSGSGQSALEGNDVVGVYTRFTCVVESLVSPRVEIIGVEPMSNASAQFRVVGDLFNGGGWEDFSYTSTESACTTA